MKISKRVPEFQQHLAATDEKIMNSEFKDYKSSSRWTSMLILQVRSLPETKK